MMDHIQARTLHARRGALKNDFTYGVDYVLTDFTSEPKTWLLSRNRWNLWSLWDHRHGGPRDAGRGVDWFREVLAERGFSCDSAQLVLLAQPSFLWFNFNPVSFWVALVDGAPRAFVAEVNNTFGQRHCYFCAHEDFRPIDKRDRLTARKLMHVSPFQKVVGDYHFNFGLSDEAVSIRITYENGDQGVLATLDGPRKKVTNRSLLWASLRRPFGAARVVALIHWQALILYLKRAPFLKKQPPLDLLVSDNTSAAGK